MTADGSLSEEEVSSFRQWLHDHKGEDLPAIGHLLGLVETIAADGRVTDKERRELYIALETVLPPDIRAIARKARRSVEETERENLRLQRELDRESQREARERNSPIEHWDFMLAGAAFEGRPSLIERHAHVGAPVHLVRDPGNKYSRNAIEVRTTSGHQIGFVPETEAVDLAPLLDAGHPYFAQIKKILIGRRYPIPVIVADVYRKDSTLPNLFDPRVPAPRANGRRSSKLRTNLIKVTFIIMAVFLLLYWLGPR